MAIFSSMPSGIFINPSADAALGVGAGDGAALEYPLVSPAFAFLHFQRTPDLPLPPPLYTLSSIPVGITSGLNPAADCNLDPLTEILFCKFCSSSKCHS